MQLGNIIEFRKDLYFEGAVQIDWFYDQQKAAKVAENFVFHGKDYFGVDAKKDSIDTVSLVKELAEKFGKETENPRTLAIADYGTGKSHLAVTMAVLFSGPQFMPKTYSKVLDNIRNIDEEAAVALTDLCKDRNFVIVLNGIRDFNLHSELLKATQRSLNLYGVDDSELKKLNHTIDTATRFFELNSETHLEDFEKMALARGWHEKGKALVSRINAEMGASDDAFEIVNDVYELITGQRIRWEEGISAKSILEMLLSRYCGLNGQFDNVIVLFDEFGRYLEYASGTDGGKCGDNALQEIFEVSQNAEGTLQVINFIQTDIKSYLLRVDQSRNLSRYIGRYDESKKYHISSNLETVFANLISRKDKSAFKKEIISWQNEKEEEWQNVFEQINQWTQTTGIWADYEQFRKVIVEGIFPLHPISVLMLTQLSDYLQNRSSMNLISQYISGVLGVDIGQEKMPIIIPTELMKGDLFVEMLAAETSGRHRSDYCIRYENVLKKNEQKLNDVQLEVLRANLVTRTLRFNTQTYDDARASLLLCSGISESELDDALTILVDEYAVMAFDEMSGCFDFTEDAKGAYDYKILKKRLLAQQKTDIRNLLGTASILEIGGFAQDQQTNFATAHKIMTNEWCYTQDVILAEDFSLDAAKKYVLSWENSRSVVNPKGRLIWAYVNKDTDYHVVDQLQEYSKLFVGTPVVLMLLNDEDNKLQNVLVEYDVLDHMDESTRNAYSSIFVKDRERVIDNLKNAFSALRMKREQVTPSGTEKWKKRIPIALTDLFECIYPNAISYNFDGLLTSGNNFTGNGIKYYCQIMRMLLSNKVNFDTIHDFTIDIRNRIEALFMIDNVSSWKCLTSDCAIVSPLNDKARKIFDIVESILKEEEKYSCKQFFDVFCAPPYGLSEEAAAMFLAIVFVNLWHNLRVEYNGVKKTISEWKDEVIEDKKLHLDVLKATQILWVDTGSAEAKLQRLFQRINDNTDINEAKRLDEELKTMIEFYGLPESLNVHKRLADMRIKQFREAEHTWQGRIEDVEKSLDAAEERRDVSKAVNTIEMIQNISIATIFGINNIDVSEEYENELIRLRKRADSIIRGCFDFWLSRNVYCQSVDQMKNFEKFYTRCRDSLDSNGYPELAKKLDQKGERELANKAEIKSRQELISDGHKFISDGARVAQTNYLEIKELVKRAEDLEKRFTKFGEGLGREALRLSKDVHDLSEKLIKRKKVMDDNMAAVFDTVAEAETVDGLELAEESLNTVLGYTIPEIDRTEYKELKKLLDALKEDCSEIMKKNDDRSALLKTEREMMEKYESNDLDYDFMPIILNCIEITKCEMGKRDLKWRQENVTLGDKTRQSVHHWKRIIDELPAYLSDETLKKVKKLDAEADQIISEGKIEDVILYFERLNSDEKKKCLDLLNSNYDETDDAIH